MEYIKIESIDSLKAQAENKDLECFIALTLGRSSKIIRWNTAHEVFKILNEIDDTFQTLKEDELSTESNIARAIDNGTFYKYKY
jgi:hypothetical protein